jgi:hypothetical protein
MTDHPRQLPTPLGDPDWIEPVPYRVKDEREKSAKK